jgi:hypothetical protein
MTLKEILQEVGLTQVSYSSYLQQGYLPFMRVEEAGKSKFGPQHLLAMRIFRLLRDYGLKPSLAGDAVNKAFASIQKVADGLPLTQDDQEVVGAQTYVSDADLITTPMDVKRHAIAGAVLVRTEVNIQVANQLLEGERKLLKRPSRRSLK